MTRHNFTFYPFRNRLTTLSLLLILSILMASSPLSSNLDGNTSGLSALDQQAIDCALNYQWEKALDLNKKIIKENPQNVACLNRLARALFELGKYNQAKKIYIQVLELDPYNTIAQKNLKRAQAFKKDSKNNGIKSEEKKSKPIGGLFKGGLFFLRKATPKKEEPSKNNISGNLPKTPISPSLFLEEAGVTKVVNLIKLAEPQRLSKLYAGSEVKLLTKNRGIAATDDQGNYLGVLADDISHHLLRLMRGGNKYFAFIKSVRPNGLTILIRETYRARRFKNQPSFIDNIKAATYSSDHITLSFDNGADETPEVEEAEEV